MPFLNFGCNKAKYYSLSDMNFFLKNMKNRYSDLDPLFPNVDHSIWIRIHVKMRWIRNAEKKTIFNEYSLAAAFFLNVLDCPFNFNKQTVCLQESIGASS